MPRERKEKKPLPDVKCGDTKCEDGLHSYKPKRKPKGKDYEGTACHACGEDPINWPEFRKRNLADTSRTIEALKTEYDRNAFWNLEIEDFLREELLEKGPSIVENEIDARIQKSIKKSGKEIFRDGTQTPMKTQNIIYFAQHATATCCRKCLARWHNVQYDKELDLSDIQYIKKLMRLYIVEKVPELRLRRE